MIEHEHYRAFCDRICTYLMSYELGIPFQWDTPLPIEGNGRRGSGVQEVHGVQRSSEPLNQPSEPPELLNPRTSEPSEPPEPLNHVSRRAPSHTR